MSLVWHIVKKDFRRLAGPLALWSLLLLAKGEVGARALKGSGDLAGRVLYLSVANTALPWLDAMVCVLLVAALIHEDTLVGTRVAWVTRPISGARLLAAKLFGAALMFGVLPLLVAVRWWIVCGYDAGEMVRAALATTDVQVVTVLAAFLLATITKNMNQFLGWALGVGVAILAWVFVLGLIINESQAEITRGVSETRSALLVVILAIGGMTAVLIQFFTRRRDHALRVMAVTAGLLAIVFGGAWDFSNRWTSTAKVTLLAGQISVAVENPRLGRQAAMDYVLHGVPEDFGVVASADHIWRWSDGVTAAARSGDGIGSWPGRAEWRSLGLAADSADTALTKAYVTSGPDPAANRGEIVVPMKFLLWAAKAERLRTEPADYTGELHATLLRPSVEFELPLHDDETRARDGTIVRIEHVEWIDGEWRITLVDSRPDWTAYGRQRPGLRTLMSVEARPAAGFALVNRARNEAVKLWPGRFPVARFLVGTQVVARITMQCSVPRDAAEEKSGARPHWLEGATLAVVHYDEAARFDREVKIEKFGAPPEVAAVK